MRTPAAARSSTVMSGGAASPSGRDVPCRTSRYRCRRPGPGQSTCRCCSRAKRRARRRACPPDALRAPGSADRASGCAGHPQAQRSPDGSTQSVRILSRSTVPRDSTVSEMAFKPAQAPEARQRITVETEFDELADVGRVEHGHAPRHHRKVALMRHRRRHATVVVARHHNHATVARRP